MRNLLFLTVLCLLGVVLYFTDLGKMALTDPDETFYAQTAKEMYNADEWVTPRIFGKPQFEKPVLYYWLVMTSYKMFGVNEFAARFPSALFGVIGVVGMYFLGRLLFTPLCGFFSALTLATCVQYAILSRACVTDMVLAVFVLLSLLFFLTSLSKGGRAGYIMASVMASLAVLTKGPIGLFIPGLVIIIYLSVSRQWGRIKKVPVFWCVLAFLAVSLPWYIAVTRIHGGTFIGEFFGFQNVTRFMKPEHRIGTSPLFYLPVIIGGFFPWSVFLPVGIWDIYRKRGGGSGVKAHGAFLLIWFLVVFVFFSVSRTKLVTYIFPLFPVMAIVAGRVWERFVSPDGGDNRLVKYMRASYTVLAVFVFAMLAGLYFFVKYEYPEAGKATLIAGGVFTGVFILSALMFSKDMRSRSFYTVALAVLLLSFPVVRYVLPVIEVSESSKAACLKVRELAAPHEAVAGESDNRRGVAFYTDRVDIPDIQNHQAQLDFFSRKDRVWGIIKRKHYDVLKKERPDLVEPVFRAGGKVVITNKI
ncbi:MAG: glycosyltransferase family 39 protein [Candidatus Omnitrophota bacterium]